ncbi:MAG: alkaline phosphatase family protein [Nanoarchaeota archaeon]|nr:alkaline phosphatase family protein [Nanoarchaeota archaeon]
MNKPDYNGGSIINLISSIGGAFEYKSKYKNLRILPSSEIKLYNNVVLMVIDGLGYDFLKKNGGEKLFGNNLRGKITSVFPSSTTAAIPTFLTGDSTKQHGMTGWHSYLKEFGTIAVPLRYRERIENGADLSKLADIRSIFNIQSIFDKLKTKSFIIQPIDIINSAFSKAAGGNTKRIGYSSMNTYFKAIAGTVNSSKNKKYIYAYYSEHDYLSHKKGADSKEVFRHFSKLTKKINSLVKSLEGTNTLVIITADHGEIDIPSSKRILMNDHPKLKEMLILPLCGESRFAYCYVKNSRYKDFERYVKSKMNYCCNIYKSNELLKNNLFGLFEENKNLKDRIGDFVIIMKDNYAIYDRLLYQDEKNYHIGEHGGLSSQELYVPLLIFKTK